jgi:hypothetical protein
MTDTAVADRLIHDKEAHLKRHAPTTPKTFDELLARMELGFENYKEFLTPEMAGAVESLHRARRWRDDSR